LKRREQRAVGYDNLPGGFGRSQTLSTATFTHCRWVAELHRRFEQTQFPCGYLAGINRSGRVAVSVSAAHSRETARLNRSLREPSNDDARETLTGVFRGRPDVVPFGDEQSLA
jgi:hypothetical protein